MIDALRFTVKTSQYKNYGLKQLGAIRLEITF